MKWLLIQWPYATFFAAWFLAALLVPFYHFAGLPLTLVFAQLPLYMFHQLEEHYHDRFRLFINKHIADGRDALTPEAVWWINSVGVWAYDLVALYLAIYCNLALGLIGIYLTLVNAVVHVVAAIVGRGYNPGLWSALFLFFPLGIWSACVVSAASHATLHDHLLACGLAVLLHIGIIVHIRLRLYRLKTAA
ncbi:MAG: HXXEE domain-containing protein [Chthoniobacterales bacterium]